MEIERQHFAVVLHPEPEGGFTVRVPALPEVVTYGETEEEVLRMAEDAIRLALNYRHAQGEEIPAEGATQLREVTVVRSA